MNKAQSHLSSCDSRSAGLARVCLALAKTDSETAWQCRYQGKTVGADLQPSPTGPSIVNQAQCSAGLRHVTIPIAEAAQRLRGLVQHVLSPWRDFGAVSAT